MEMSLEACAHYIHWHTVNTSARENHHDREEPRRDKFLRGRRLLRVLTCFFFPSFCFCVFCVLIYWLRTYLFYTLVLSIQERIHRYHCYKFLRLGNQAYRKLDEIRQNISLVHHINMIIMRSFSDSENLVKQRF